MGKGIKIFLSVMSTLILASIILPIFLSVLLSFSAVQNFVVDKATHIISERLGAKISIAHIDMDLFRRVRLSEVYVEDLSGDTLLFANHIGASLASNGFIRGNYDLGRIELRDAKLYLVQDSTRTLNLATLLRKLKREDRVKKKDFHLYSRRVDIENLDFVLRNYDPKPDGEGINFQDIGLEGFAMRGTRFSIDGDSIHMRLGGMRFDERSGFVLDTLTSRSLALASSGIYLEEMTMTSGRSQVEMPYINLHSDSWESYADFVNEVVLDGHIENSAISSETLGYFAASLADWDLLVENLDFEFSGTVDNLRAQINSLRVAGTSLRGDIAVRGLPEIDKTRFDFSVERLNTASASAARIVENITGKALSPELIEHLAAMENITFEGRFNGQFTDFEAGGTFASALGDVSLDLNLRPLQDSKTGFEGRVSTDGFELGELLAAENMGSLAIQGSMRGIYGLGEVLMNTNATISSFELNDFEYTDIGMNGRFQDKNFVGQVRSNSEHVKFEFDGMLDFNDSIPSYNFDLRLDDVDLVATNINKRDSISNLSCQVVAKASGTNLDDIDGTITVHDLLYVNHQDSVRTGNIDFVANNETDYKRLYMSSDFADAEFMGSSSYSDMFVYLDRALRNYLPSISGTIVPNKEVISGSGSQGQSQEYYVVQIDVKQANNVAGIFVPGLQVAEGTSAVFMLNPVRDMLSLNVTSDYIEHGNTFVSNLSLNSRNQGDSISMYIRADDFFAGGMYLPNLSIIGGARNNEVMLDTRMGSDDAAAKAYISTTTMFTQDSTGLAQVRLRFNPSTFTINDQEWFLIGEDIVVDTTGVRVGGFNVRGLGQSLSVSGYASRNVEDTLRVQFSNFDMAPLSAFVERAGYQISGRTSGYVNAVSALNTDVLMAELAFDSMMVNQVAIPDTRFTSQWDQSQRRASIAVDRVDSNERLIDGYFRPMDRTYAADVDLKGLDMSLLTPVLSTIIADTEGSADAKLTVEGDRSGHHINGSMVVDSLSTRVLFTNVDYNIGRTELEVKDNVLLVSSARLSDSQGGSGELGGSFDVGNFKNLKYTLTVRANRLLALNTTIADNELFYGRVLADGLVTVRGDNLGSNMYVTAQTSGPSELYMPLSGSESAMEADFIVFQAPRAVDNEEAYDIRKQNIISGRARRENSAGGNFDMSMQFNVDPNLEFQLVIDPTVGDIIRGRGNGTINMNINPRNNEFTMYGDYGITDGSYLFTLRNIINKRFVIQPGGTIQWTGDPVDALLDISAVYQLKASLAPLLNSSEYSRRVSVDCEIQLADRLSQPLITFDVQVPDVDAETRSLVNSALNTQEMKATQFLWLLAVNSFYSDSSNSEYSVNIGATGTAVTGIELLSNQLSNWLSSERFSLVPRYIPSSETSDDEFGVEFSAELIKNKLVIEGQGSYGSSTNVSSLSENSTNFSNDLTAYWLFDQEGSLKAKAFTRTVDSFDENQGLQESGVGIFYSESFNNLRDLAENLKRRFARKKDDDIDDDEDE